MGVPKTIDNDLVETDHCPGYGSAARFLALATREIGVDTRAMQHSDPVRVIEVMGRHAGWLAAAAALGKERPEDAPHLTLLPERPLSLDDILAAVGEAQRAYGHAVVVPWTILRTVEDAHRLAGRIEAVVRKVEGVIVGHRAALPHRERIERIEKSSSNL